MKTSLKDRILKYARNHGDWINSGEIERLCMNAGYKASNGSRRCREMESGKLSNGKTCPIVLENKEVNGVVWYRAKPPVRIDKYWVGEGEDRYLMEKKIWQESLV